MTFSKKQKKFLPKVWFEELRFKSDMICTPWSPSNDALITHDKPQNGLTDNYLSLIYLTKFRLSEVAGHVSAHNNVFASLQMSGTFLKVPDIFDWIKFFFDSARTIVLSVGD